MSPAKILRQLYSAGQRAVPEMKSVEGGCATIRLGTKFPRQAVSTPPGMLLQHRRERHPIDSPNAQNFGAFRDSSCASTVVAPEQPQCTSMKHFIVALRMI